jgi:hypothetical protein
METVMNAKEHTTADHDEPRGSDRDAIPSTKSPDRTDRQDFSWYAGQVDERVLRVIVQLSRTKE